MRYSSIKVIRDKERQAEKNKPNKNDRGCGEEGKLIERL